MITRVTGESYAEVRGGRSDDNVVGVCTRERVSEVER